MKRETNFNGIYLIIQLLTPHKPEKVRRVCNAAAEYQAVALNDKLLSGPDLLQSLIGIIFRFREHEIALSADIEAMFLQVAVPTDDSRCLRFQSRESMFTSTHDTFLGRNFADLCKLRFASSGER